MASNNRVDKHPLLTQAKKSNLSTNIVEDLYLQLSRKVICAPRLFDCTWHVLKYTSYSSRKHENICRSQYARQSLQLQVDEGEPLLLIICTAPQKL